MRTYRQVFAVGEFRALFGGQLAIGASMTIQVLAVSVLIYSRTASPLLAAIGFLAGSVPQAVGAMTLSGLADRLAPRDVLVITDAVRAAGFLVIASGVLPVAGIVAVLMVSGVVLGALAGIRFSLLTRVLPVDAYVLGRSVLDTASGGMQIAGYAAGGGLVVVLGAPGAMWIAVLLAVIACLTDRYGLHTRPPVRSRRGSAGDGWRARMRLLRGRPTGRLLVAQWVPNGLIVGAEAMFVPYAGHRAAILLTTSAAGLLVGTVLVGRWLPAGRRSGASLPLYLLLAIPYLAFVAEPPIWLAVVLVAVASTGYAGTLGLQQRLVAAVPPDSLGQAFALASAGMLTAQGLAAYVAGGIAQATTPGIAMTTMAAASIIATLSLLARASESDGPAEGPATAARSPRSRKRLPALPSLSVHQRPRRSS